MGSYLGREGTKCDQDGGPLHFENVGKIACRKVCFGGLIEFSASSEIES